MNDRGFTLIEIMIVVAIIGILAAVAIPKFFDYKENVVKKYRVIDTISVGFADIKKVCWDGKVLLIDPEGEITDLNETCDDNEVTEDRVVKKEIGHISYD